MACDATARLYDVDEDSVVFTRLRKSERYDQATITFRARQGKTIDLDKLHESIWATRLSGGTRSGLVSLEVTATGRMTLSGDEVALEDEDSRTRFVIGRHADDKFAAVFERLKSEAAGKVVQVTGVIGDYSGRWPNVLRSKPKNPRQLLVTNFEIQ